MAERFDFPFYNGKPVALTGRDWTIVIGAVLIAFALLITLPLPNFPLSFIPPLLFTGLPLAALALVAGRHWTALFQRYGLKQFGQSVGFAALTVIASFAAGLLLSQFISMTANPSYSGTMTGFDFSLLLLRSFIQLIGEEAVTILPLLAVLWLCVAKFGLSRRAGLIIGVVVSTVWFAAMHLPTYNWNVLQCLLTIGTARLVLTASYLVTRNMAVSVGAHILNDWTLFFISFIGAHGPIEAVG
jgi:membrane protease YdiL (CAAX protease family)